MVKKELQKEEKPAEEETIEYVYESELEKVKDQYPELQDVFEKFNAIAGAKYRKVWLQISNNG